MLACHNKESHAPSETRDDGPPSRARRVGTGAGVWRGRGVLSCLGCSLPLFACHVEKNMYQCFVEVWNTKIFTARHYVGAFIYCVINCYISRYIRVYAQIGVFFNCFSCSLVATRRQTTVESAEDRNRSWSMGRTWGVGLFRLLSAPI